MALASASGVPELDGVQVYTTVRCRVVPFNARQQPLVAVRNVPEAEVLRDGERTLTVVTGCSTGNAALWYLTPSKLDGTLHHK